MTNAAWLHYCRIIGRGGDLQATYARMCYALGEATPSRARRKIEALLKGGQMDSAGYVQHSDAIECLEDKWICGGRCQIVDTHDRSAWQPLDGGGHMRINHK